MMKVKGKISAIGLSLLIALVTFLSACGDNGSNSQQSESGAATSAAKGANSSGTNTTTSAQALAQSYLAAWEANDGAKMDKLLVPSPYSGSSTLRLTDRSSRFGAPVPGSGRILNLVENGGTATADVAVMLNCLNVTGCTPDLLASQPEWVGRGQVVASDKLTLQRQTDGKSWLILAIENSTYLQDLAASQTATARPTFAVVRVCLAICATITPKP